MADSEWYASSERVDRRPAHPCYGMHGRSGTPFRGHATLMPWKLSAEFNESHADGYHITLPRLAEDSLINKILKDKGIK